MIIEPQIGILHGKETEFAHALIERINKKNAQSIRAESLKIGDIPMDYDCPYDLIVDRISYKVPYYVSFLKSAILSGTYIINDPFWFEMVDHFFNFGLIARIGVPVPKSVCLPSRAYNADVSNEDLSNMVFPLDWDKVIDYIGLPVLMKPYNELGWQHEYIIKSRDQLFYQYSQSGQAMMLLQELIDYDMYVRCLTIGKKHVLTVPYDPINHRYVLEDVKNISSDLKMRLESKSREICKVLGYDMNVVEFAIGKNGKAYAVDFMNPVPAVDSHRIGADNFDWVVENTAITAIDCVKNGVSSYDKHHWYQEAKLKKHSRHRKSIKK